MIGHLAGERSARAFSDFLYVQGIENEMEAEPGDSWGVWIHAEDEIERARGLLGDYQRNPADQKYKRFARAADELKEQKRREQADYEKRLKERRHLFRPLAQYGVGLVTFLLICLCGGVYIQAKFGDGRQVQLPLFISTKDIVNSETGRPVGFQERLAHPKLILPEIRNGEIWRLITPIFIHFTFFHILFNMLWLKDLGSMIEARQGSAFLVLMVLVTAAAGNLLQFFMNGPEFGGMSGVVYGLMGYIWIRGKRDPGSGLFLHPSTVMMMIVWFVACWVGEFTELPGIGRVANYAHAGGLFMGMAWGYLSSLAHR